MPIDENSLLLAIGFCGLGLAVTFFASWLSARQERFTLTWTLAVLLIVTNAFAYGTYVRWPSLGLGAFAFGALVASFLLVLLAAYQYRGRGVPRSGLAVTAAIGGVAVLGPFATGHDGLGMMAANATSSFLLARTMLVYWSCRREAPIPITGMVALYAATSLAFALCASVLVFEGELVRGAAPKNWAEDLSLFVYTIGLTGIGALSLSLNQWRLARANRRDALTDALTGLLNRRALFDRHDGRPVPAGTGVVVFDIDRFKRVNDRHGHAVGDDVIRRFAAVLVHAGQPGDSAARLGGEEFALVLQRVSEADAGGIAQRVRHAFAAETILSAEGPVRCTVSAGVVFVDEPGYSFDSVLSLADDALYSAKREGRDRVVRTAMGRPANKESSNGNAYRPGQLAGFPGQGQRPHEVRGL
ncbi:MAG: diguanylate cyclase [Bauldia sp.]|nr:diguanylate cyclase [Bauldia sp.]